MFLLERTRGIVVRVGGPSLVASALNHGRPGGSSELSDGACCEYSTDGECGSARRTTRPLRAAE